MDNVVSFLSFLTLASNIAICLLFILFFLNKVGVLTKLWKAILSKISPLAIVFAFIIAVTATSGSLYLSEIAGFEPCKLCWFQRIFMYPQALILGIAVFIKKKDVYNYLLPLSIIGSLIGAYHYYHQMRPDITIPCSTVGFSVSCSQRFFTHYGYITIPWMSFSAFVIITLLLLVSSGRIKLR